MMRTVVLASAVLLSAVSIDAVSIDNAAPAITAAERAGHEDSEITIPAGTALRLRVTRGFGSDISRVEERVSATLAQPVTINGRTVVPAGSLVTGYVSEATRPGKVKGRGRVGVRFTRITPVHESRSYSMQTRTWTAVAPATKKKDALTIGIPAAGGAALGALIDGKKGAGIGAAVGGGAGTAAVLTTRGKEARVGRGATLLVRLASPLTIRVDD